MIDAVVELGRRGATDFEIAAELGVSVSTLNSWKKTNPAFLESLKAGKSIANSRVQDALYTRAVGFTAPDGVHHPPHPVAAIFWLKNRCPEEWRDTTRSEITGPDGAALEIQGSPRPSPESVTAFARELHKGFAAFRDDDGNPATLGDHEAGILAEVVAMFATGENPDTRAPFETGEALAKIQGIRAKLARPMNR